MKSILIVDDDPLIVHILSSVLAQEYQVITCDSGEKALSLIAKNSEIDLAIYDVDMPGINGIETAKIIWETHQIPFVIFSQFNDEAIIDQAIEIGALTYLLKPLNTEEILPAVKAALSRAHDMSNQNHRAIELTHTINQNRKILSNIIHEEEGHRKKLVNELHDEIGQRLALMTLSMNQIKALTDQHEVDTICGTVQENIKQLYQSIRDIMAGLRPEILESLCTGGALHHLLMEWKKSQTNMTVRDQKFNTSLQVAYPYDVIAYRALQELLTNITKHAAQTTEVEVTFREMEQGIELMVKDNGKGFDSATTPFSIGLSAIREKVLSVGGHFTLETAPGQGVSITLNLPSMNNSHTIDA